MHPRFHAKDTTTTLEAKRVTKPIARSVGLCAQNQDGNLDSRYKSYRSLRLLWGQLGGITVRGQE